MSRVNSKRVAKLKQPGFYVAALGVLLMVISTLPGSGAAHEPITTKVRFNKEVVRILQHSCLGCHRPGGFAPMELGAYEEARPWAKAIKEELLEKRMPPWLPERGYGDFSNAPPLTQREIDLIVNWVEGGAPKGDDKLLPEGPLYQDSWPLGEPDLVLKLDHGKSIGGDAGDERWHRVLPAAAGDRWIRAVDFTPGNGSIVHCADFYVVPASAAPEARAGSGSNGIPDLAMRGRTSEIPVHTWIPGQKPVKFPEGVARILPAGSEMAVKIHYQPMQEKDAGAGTVALYLAKSPPARNVTDLFIPSPDAAVPVGDKPHRVPAEVTIKADASLVAIRPLSHPLLVSFQATARRPDGSEEVLIWTRGHRFDWHPRYYYKQPVALPRGTVVEVVAYFDNSQTNRENPFDPPKQLNLRELSNNVLLVLMLAEPHER